MRVLKLSVLVEGRDDIEIDLTGVYQTLANLVIKICLPFLSHNSYEILLSYCHVSC